jgi:peroxiredoxin
MRKTAVLFLLLAGLLACGTLPASGQTRTLPRFSIRRADGKVVKSEDLKGNVVVIDFWGTWCKPCLTEIPEYNSLFRDYSKRGLQFLAVAVESGDAREVAAAAKRLKIEYPVAPATPKQLDAFGRIVVFPTTWVFDREGKLAKEYLGVPPGKQKEIRDLVERMLTSTP